MSDTNLKKTPLNKAHRDLGGKMVDFGGWDMPVQYTAGVIGEHLATRTRAGLFDVSHMGEFWVEGEDAIKFVDKLTTNDVTKLIMKTERSLMIYSSIVLNRINFCLSSTLRRLIKTGIGLHRTKATKISR
jgi:glycine cleavage system aminomethyltransferase T